MARAAALAALVALVAAALSWPAPAGAQTRSPVRRPAAPRVQIGGGGGVLGGVLLFDQDAQLRANGVQPSPFRLFTSETRLGAAPFAEGRLAYLWTTRLSVEARVTYSRPGLRTALSNDAEGAAVSAATGRLSEYLFEGGAAVALDEFAFGATTPFVEGGIGYARDLYEDRALVESGAAYYLGGGVTRALWPGGAGGRLGLRADARLHRLRGGIAGRGVSSTRASAGAGVFLRF